MSEYFVVLTLAKTAESGTVSQATFTWNYETQPGDTRASILNGILQGVPEQFRGGTVLFFSAEPNALGGAA